MSRPNNITQEHVNYFSKKTQNTLQRMKSRFVELPFDPQPMFEEMVPKRARELASELSEKYTIKADLYYGQHLEYRCEVQDPNRTRPRTVSRDVNVALAKPVWAFHRFHRTYASDNKLTDVGPWFTQQAQMLNKLGEQLLVVQLQLERYHKVLKEVALRFKTAGQFVQNTMDIDFCLQSDLKWRGMDRNPAADVDWKTYSHSENGEQIIDNHGIGFTLEEFREAKGAVLVASMFPEKEPKIWPDEFYS